MSVRDGSRAIRSTESANTGVAVTAAPCLTKFRQNGDSIARHRRGLTRQLLRVLGQRTRLLKAVCGVKEIVEVEGALLALAKLRQQDREHRTIDNR